MDKRDKFRGCIVGGAAGDALGYAVEFRDERSIFMMYGDRGITEYRLSGGEALISDDTQMTLFTAAGMLEGARREERSGEKYDYKYCIGRAYSDWLNTQLHRDARTHEPFTSIASTPELYSERAPGNTCMSALMSGRYGSVEHRINSSKGCGGVMRVAPVGLYAPERGFSSDETDMLGAQAAAITHGHELGFIPAAAMVHIVNSVAHSDITLRDAITDSLDAVERLFERTEYTEYFGKLMRKAVSAADSDIPDLEAIHSLGEGWVAEETLAIAVFCALRHKDSFEDALIAAVNHKGDSDSTGAVTGNILGAYLGYGAIPEKFKEHLELHGLCVDIADRLCGCD